MRDTKYPEAFYTHLRDLYAQHGAIGWLELGQQALALAGVESNHTTRDLSDLVRHYLKRHGAKTEPEAHGAMEAEMEKLQTSPEAVNHYWLKTETGSYHVVRSKGHVEQQQIAEAIRDIVNEATLRPYEPVTVNPERDESIAAIVSDMHVGLNPNPNRRAMYPVEYNADVFRANLGKVYNAIKFNVNYYGPVGLLSLSDLGDGLDGFNRLTTRGGHELEQNMDNLAMFETFVREKLRLAENLIHSGMAKRYVFNNVSNDNHAGDLAAIANTTIQMILERSYPKEVVQFRVMHKPMEHFIYGDHCFILLHGKDQQYQFKGFPLLLDAKTEKAVRTYMDRHGIKSKYVHVWKGDLHQLSYSKCEAFDYRNFMSFAPPSQWVANNFPGSYSGFSIQRIPKWTNEIQHMDYVLEFEPVGVEAVEEWVY